MTVVPQGTNPVNVPDAAERVGEWAIPGAEGLKLRVAESGVGKPVVFLHGLVGLNDHWEQVVEHVRDRSRCIMLEVPLLDLKGDLCSIEGVTNVTRSFLSERVGEPVVLVGNSFGGHVALRLAIEQPEMVRGLVLAGSSGLFERTVFRDAPIRPSRDWLAKKIGELFYDPSNVWESDIDRAFAELSRREGARAMVRLSKSAKQDHLGDRLAFVQSPTLLLWGRNDVVTPPETAEEFHRLIAGSRLEWLDRCGHAPMMEYPREFAERMRAFLASIETNGEGRA